MSWHEPDDDYCPGCVSEPEAGYPHICYCAGCERGPDFAHTCPEADREPEPDPADEPADWGACYEAPPPLADCDYCGGSGEARTWGACGWCQGTGIISKYLENSH